MLFRSLGEHPRYADSAYVHLWVHLLLKATHQPIKRIFGGEEIVLRPGELITSRDSISSQTGINPSKVERLLRMMVKSCQIEQRTSNTNRVITITNWSFYQAVEQQPHTSRTSCERREDTNNNTNTEEQKTISSPSMEAAILIAQEMGFTRIKAEEVFFSLEASGWKWGNRCVEKWESAFKSRLLAIAARNKRSPSNRILHLASPKIGDFTTSAKKEL